MGIFQFLGNLVGSSGLGNPQPLAPTQGYGPYGSYTGTGPLGDALQNLATVGLATSYISNGRVPNPRPGGFFDTISKMYAVNEALGVGSAALGQLFRFAQSLFGQGGAVATSPWGPTYPDVAPWLRNPSNLPPQNGLVSPQQLVNFPGLPGPTNVDTSGVAPVMKAQAFRQVYGAVDAVRQFFAGSGFTAFSIPSAVVNNSGVVSLAVQQGGEWQQTISIRPGLTREAMLAEIERQIRTNRTVPVQVSSGWSGTVAPSGTNVPLDYAQYGAPPMRPNLPPSGSSPWMVVSDPTYGPPPSGPVAFGGPTYRSNQPGYRPGELQDYFRNNSLSTLFQPPRA